MGEVVEPPVEDDIPNLGSIQPIEIQEEMEQSFLDLSLIHI